MKDFILKLLGVETYEVKNKELTSELVSALDSYDIQKQVSIDLLHENEQYKKLLESVIRERDLLKSDPEQYIAEEIEKRMLEVSNNPARHRAYQIGRQDAYAQMGIRNIEAHEMGGFLAIMPDGEIIPLLSLEDFDDLQEEKPEWRNKEVPEEWQKVLDESIVIDDLTEIGA